MRLIKYYYYLLFYIVPFEDFYKEITREDRLAFIRGGNVKKIVKNARKRLIKRQVGLI